MPRVTPTKYDRYNIKKRMRTYARQLSRMRLDMYHVMELMLEGKNEQLAEAFANLLHGVNLVEHLVINLEAEI